jgi:type III secretion protein L
MYLFKIKDNFTVHGTSKIIPKNEFAAILDAKTVLEEAEKEAKAIIERAHEEAKKIHQEAKDQGFNEGLEPYNAHIVYFEDRVKHLRHELQKTLLPLVYKTTKRIVGEALTKHPEIVVDVVTQVIKEVSSNHEIKLYVNRADLEVLEENKEQFKQLFERLDLFSIEERGDVERGSCIIQTEKGILNANLENQFKALKKALKID